MKTVGIAELKAHLSSYLRSVRRGRDLVVLDRGTPVARIVAPGPGTPLAVQPPARSLRSVKLPPPPRRRVDSLAALREERGER